MGTVPPPLARPRPEPQDASPQDESELVFSIDEEEYASEMRVLQEVSIKSLQTMMRELYQREKAVPEYCDIAQEDFIHLNKHDRDARFLSRDPISLLYRQMNTESILKVVNPIIGTPCTLRIQPTFTRGTLMFYWRRAEKQSYQPKANPSIISIVKR